EKVGHDAGTRFAPDLQHDLLATLSLARAVDTEIVGAHKATRHVAVHLADVPTGCDTSAKRAWQVLGGRGTRRTQRGGNDDDDGKNRFPHKLVTLPVGVPHLRDTRALMLRQHLERGETPVRSDAGAVRRIASSAYRTSITRLSRLASINQPAGRSRSLPFNRRQLAQGLIGLPVAGRGLPDHKSPKRLSTLLHNRYAHPEHGASGLRFRDDRPAVL